MFALEAPQTPPPHRLANLSNNERKIIAAEVNDVATVGDDAKRIRHLPSQAKRRSNEGSRRATNFGPNNLQSSTIANAEQAN